MRSGFGQVCELGLAFLHGLIALPVMLSVLGPRPFSSSKKEYPEEEPQGAKVFPPGLVDPTITIPASFIAGQSVNLDVPPDRLVVFGDTIGSEGRSSL